MFFIDFRGRLELYHPRLGLSSPITSNGDFLGVFRNDIGDEQAALHQST